MKEKEESIWRKQNNWNTEEKKGGEGNGEKCSKKEKFSKDKLSEYILSRGPFDDSYYDGWTDEIQME